MNGRSECLRSRDTYQGPRSVDVSLPAIDSVGDTVEFFFTEP